VRIGVIGATGPAGQAAATQLAGIGFEVVVGSRAIERAAETVSTLKGRWPGRFLELVPGENQEAASADLVIVATPWDGVLSTIAALKDRLAGKIVISMANALTRWGRDMVPLIPPTGSVTVAVAAALPDSRVVGAFHHLPAGPWSDLDHELDADVLVCSDDRQATTEVIGLIDLLPGLRGVDAGGLASALAIEALTAALLEVNRRYKTHTAIRITGLPERARS
jgi:8-hydroxy-5-deazaflavin:NADPH oxidoreductase